MRWKNGLLTSALAASTVLVGCMTAETSPVQEPEEPHAAESGDTVWITVDKAKEMGLEYRKFRVMGEEREGLLTKVGDQWVWDGDIVVQVEPESGANALGKASGNWAPSAVKWPNAVIPYKMDATVSTQVKAAVAEWNRMSGAKWVPLAQIYPAPASYVYFHHYPNTSSNLAGTAPVGMQPGVNEVSLYGSVVTQSTIAHEMGHIMGLLHEHTRTDRDSNVTIFYDASARDRLCNSFYGWLGTTNTNPYGDKAGPNYYPSQYCTKGGEKLGPYDQNSIMHYERREKYTQYCLAVSQTSSTCSVVKARLTEVSGKPSIAGAGKAVSWWDGYWISVKYNTKGGADLVGVRRTGNATPKTWVHRVSAAGEGLTPFTTYNLNTETGYISYGTNVEFIMGDYNGDGVEDLIGMARYGAAGANMTVAVMDGASDFKTLLLSGQTPLPQTTSSAWSFTTGDFNKDGRADIYAVNRLGAKTDLHILNASGGYASFLYQIPTALPQAGSDWSFAAGDFDNDGKSDLYCIYKAGASGTEVHVLSAASGFATYVCQRVTAIGNTNSPDWNFKVRDWDRDGKPDLYAINRNGPNRTDVHLMSGSSNYTQYMWQMGTPLPVTTSTDWELE